MAATTREFTIAELSTLSGVPVRTIRYYVAQGLLPSPGREGPASRYGEATLARLRLIRQLQAAHQPLSAIRERLAALTDAQIGELAATPEPAPSDSALEYVRALLGKTAPPAPPVRHASLLKRIEPARPAETTPAAYSQPATQPERSQWERIVLEPDIELHVRRPLSRPQNQRVERLLAFARELQEGGQP